MSRADAASGPAAPGTVMSMAGSAVSDTGGAISATDDVLVGTRISFKPSGVMIRDAMTSASERPSIGQGGGHRRPAPAELGHGRGSPAPLKKTEKAMSLRGWLPRLTGNETVHQRDERFTIGGQG